MVFHCLQSIRTYILSCQHCYAFAQGKEIAFILAVQKKKSAAAGPFHSPCSPSELVYAAAALCFPDLSLCNAPERL